MLRYPGALCAMLLAVVPVSAGVDAGYQPRTSAAGIAVHTPTSLAPSLRLTSGNRRLAQAAQPNADDATAANFWATIRDSDNPALYEEYLRRFPNHSFAPVARAKLESLRVQQEAAEKEAPGPAAEADAGPRDLATELQTALQNIGCYTKGIDGDWGRGSRAALQRFNTLSGNEFPLEPPSVEAVAAVEAWRGEPCTVIAAPKTSKPARKKARKSKSPTKRRRTTVKKKPAAPSTGGVGVIIGGGRGGVGIGIGGGIRF